MQLMLMQLWKLYSTLKKVVQNNRVKRAHLKSLNQKKNMIQEVKMRSNLKFQLNVEFHVKEDFQSSQKNKRTNYHNGLILSKDWKFSIEDIAHNLSPQCLKIEHCRIRCCLQSGEIQNIVK